MGALLSVSGLTVRAGTKRLLNNLSLTIEKGSLHILMGPNGSGKSTLALSLMGHPSLTVAARALTLAGRDIRRMTPDERARAGMFLAFQNPLTIAGISLATLLPEALRTSLAHSTVKKMASTFSLPTLASQEAARQRDALTAVQDRTKKIFSELGLEDEMMYRSLNEGFSGGEKKKAEIVQLVALAPKLAILDEPDSGLDVDALKRIAGIIGRLQKLGTAILLITHYPRVARYLKPTRVHILHRGSLVASGGREIASRIEKHGFDAVLPANTHDKKSSGTQKNTRD